MLSGEVQDKYQRLRIIWTIIMAAFVAISSAAIYVWFLYTTSDDVSAWREVEFKHFPATIGLPISAVGAFLVVSLFRTTQGTIRIRVMSITFEGASGPIIMWVLCFLAMALAIKLLW
jgi:hypothetical protein